jgi:tetratricopeptide (TPR) repeat protein
MAQTITSRVLVSEFGRQFLGDEAIEALRGVSGRRWALITLIGPTWGFIADLCTVFGPAARNAFFISAAAVVVFAAAVFFRTRYRARCAVPCVVSIILAVSFGVISAVQWLTDTGDIGFLHASAARIEGKIDSLSQEQRKESTRAEQLHSEEMEEQKKLERLVLDTSAGGAAAVQAIAGIRDSLRPGNPDIDSIPAEKLPALVKRIIEDLNKPAANPEDFSGTVKRVLTEAQADTAQLKFSDAAKVLDAALAEAEAADKERARGRAGLQAERGRVASLQLRYKDAAGYYSRAAEAVASDPADALKYRRQAANALYAMGYEFGDNAALEQAIAAYQSLLDATSHELAPLDWAKAENSLGTALSTLGERERGTSKLEQAIAAYRAALEELTRERVPLDWATTQTNLGTALGTLGKRESRTAQLEEAVTAFRAALEELTRERAPLKWAATQTNLGNALLNLGKLESGTARLDEAVVAYRAALQGFTRERAPFKWAATQIDLGVALRMLLKLVRPYLPLAKQAVTAFRAALEELTRDRVPLEWAAAQTNLGKALRELGARESGTVKLEEAVAAYCAALEELTRDRVPLEWAGTQTDLGNALATLGEWESGTVKLEEAVAAYRAALEEWTRDRSPLPWVASFGGQGVAMILIADRTNNAALAEVAAQQIEASYETLRSGGNEALAAFYQARLPGVLAIRDRLKGK